MKDMKDTHSSTIEAARHTLSNLRKHHRMEPLTGKVVNSVEWNQALFDIMMFVRMFCDNRRKETTDFIKECRSMLITH